MRYLAAAFLCLFLIGCKTPQGSDHGKWWVTCKWGPTILFDEEAQSVTSKSNGVFRIHIKHGAYFYIHPGREGVVTCREYYNNRGKSTEEKWD